MTEKRFTPTPGPWLLDDDARKECGQRGIAWLPKGSKKPVEVAWTVGLYPDETDLANAHLIASAPALYEACQTLVEEFDAGLPKDNAWALVDAIRAALRLARGEGDSK